MKKTIYVAIESGGDYEDAWSEARVAFLYYKPAKKFTDKFNFKQRNKRKNQSEMGLQKVRLLLKGGPK